MGEEEWRARLVQVVAQQVRRRRLEVGLSVQKFADICTEQYGLPLKRSVLANFEGGRRPALSVVELLVFARILAVPPAELLFPVGRVDEIEVLPDTSASTWEALRWFTGESDSLPTDGEASQDARTVRWYREHEQLLTEWWARRKELEVSLATEGRVWLEDHQTGTAPSEDMTRRMIELKADVVRATEASITLLRRQMREAGLTPPDLDSAAQYIEPEPSSEQAKAKAPKGES